MPELVPLTQRHLEAVRSFELDNREYFARFITDRGDAFFANFGAQHEVMLARQAAGECAFYVLIDDDTGSVLGRFNLYEIGDGSAGVGYRLAEAAAGRGVATRALRDLCHRAAHTHGLTRLTARAARANVASRRVLAKAGFSLEGDCVVAGRPGVAFSLALGAEWAADRDVRDTRTR